MLGPRHGQILQDSRTVVGGVHAKQWCASLYPLGAGGLTFCQSMMRMMREMIVRTTKARIAEIITTLKGRAGGRDKRWP